MIIFILFMCILSAGFFAGLETGLIAADQYLLFAKREKKVFYAVAADFLLLKPERLLSTTLVGTNIAVVTAAVVLNSYLRDIGFIHFSWLGSLALTLVLLIFSEVIPKSFFRQHADTLSVRLAPALVVFYYIFLPVSFILNCIVRLLLFVTGQSKSTKRMADSKQDLKLLVKLSNRDAGISSRAQRIIEDIFDFQETMAREVMIQIHQTYICNVDHPVEEAVAYALGRHADYVPLFAGRPDNIIGYLDMNDLILDKKENCRALMHEAVFYPDIKRIPNLLIEMNRKNLDVVFLCNEYGRITGMLTQREIVSEIIGFAPGRMSVKERAIQELSAHDYEIFGITDIEDFQNEIGIRIPRGGYDTIGGFLLDRMGRIPRVGTEHIENGVRYTILEADELHIKKIRVELIH
jgi:CBS domain containing-hemolysin-like protein